MKKTYTFCKSFISLIMASVITLSTSSCGFFTTIKAVSVVPNDDNKDYTSEEFLHSFKKITISDKTMSEHVSKFESIIAEYYWEQYYMNDQKLEEVLLIADSYSECNNTDTDYYEVADIIIANSIECGDIQNAFFRDTGTITDVTIDYNYREELHRQCLDIALNNCLRTSSNVAEDICSYKDLKIVFGETYDDAIAYYDWDKNIIVISKSSYNRLKNDDERKRFLIDTLQHELNHVRQFICDCRVEAGQKNESIATNYGLNLNIESTAESQICNTLSSAELNGKITADYTYADERIDESLLLLMAVFKEGRNIDDYYKAIFDTNLPALYDYFDLKSADDYKTFYNVALTLDTLTGRGPLAKRLILEDHINRYGDIKAQVGFGYKIDVFKIALGDLMEAINKDESLTIVDSIVLYNILKSYIVSQSFVLNYAVEKADGSTTYHREFQQSFVEGILDCEKIFYDYLVDLYGVTYDDIKYIELCNLDDNLTMFENLRDNGRWSYNTSDVATKLVSKFPLLKEIIWNFPVSYYSGRSFKYEIEKKENSIVPKLTIN